jgi:hypothetical protein
LGIAYNMCNYTNTQMSTETYILDICMYIHTHIYIQVKSNEMQLTRLYTYTHTHAHTNGKSTSQHTRDMMIASLIDCHEKSHSCACSDTYAEANVLQFPDQNENPHNVLKYSYTPFETHAKVSQNSYCSNFEKSST